MHGFRIPSLVIKELLTILRDPRARIVLIAPPLAMLLIFSFAANMEVKNVAIAIYNQDEGQHGREIVSRLTSANTFTKVIFVQSTREFVALLDEQQVMLTVNIPSDFSRRIAGGEQGRFQVLLDGRRSNSAQIANGYIRQIVLQYAQEQEAAPGRGQSPAIVITRSWFNENLLYMWHTLPGLMGILSMLLSLMVTSMSVAREKELGTFEQLLVSPLMPREILIGKTIPGLIVGFCESILLYLAIRLIYGVPYNSSFLLLLLVILIFMLSVVGVGLFISSLARTQQQAVLGTFVFMVPAITLSGFAAPLENMPGWMQTGTLINPLRYGFFIIKSLFLKDLPFIEIWNCLWPLLIISIFTLALSSWFFTRRLE